VSGRVDPILNNMPVETFYLKEALPTLIRYFSRKAFRFVPFAWSSDRFNFGIAREV
jgi:hypothetical protein